MSDLIVQAYGFDRSGSIPRMVLNEFSTTADGQLAHYTDGDFRAIVPPEGWQDYCDSFPDALPIVQGLLSAKPLVEMEKLGKGK